MDHRGGLLVEEGFKVITFGSPHVACQPGTEDEGKKTLEEAWEAGKLEGALGGFDKFTKDHFLNVVNEYDVVPRAYVSSAVYGESSCTTVFVHALLLFPGLTFVFRMRGVCSSMELLLSKNLESRFWMLYPF